MDTTLHSESLPMPGSIPLFKTSTSHGLTHHLCLVPQIINDSLRFDPIACDVPEGAPPLHIGRFTSRSELGALAANALGSNKLAFKSKVVSRTHAEIWCERGGRFFIRDSKSSSGTFLNHVRLSAANVESRPFELRDGDTLQLGVDYQGGVGDIYKCARIRVEIGRERQASASAPECVYPPSSSRSGSLSCCRTREGEATGALAPGLVWFGCPYHCSCADTASRNDEVSKL
jgi:hypothetical protein